MALLVEVEVKKWKTTMLLQVCLWLAASLQQFEGWNEIEVHPQLPHFKAHVVDQLAGSHHILLVKEIWDFYQTLFNSIELLNVVLHDENFGKERLQGTVWLHVHCTSPFSRQEPKFSLRLQFRLAWTEIPDTGVLIIQCSRRATRGEVLNGRHGSSGVGRRRHLHGMVLPKSILRHATI